MAISSFSNMFNSKLLVITILIFWVTTKNNQNIWVNYNSLTWIVRPFGDDFHTNMIVWPPWAASAPRWPHPGRRHCAAAQRCIAGSPDWKKGSSWWISWDLLVISWDLLVISWDFWRCLNGIFWCVRLDVHLIGRLSRGIDQSGVATLIRGIDEIGETSRKTMA